MMPFYEVAAYPIPVKSETRLARFQYFARRHPVATGAGSFAVMATLVLLVSFVLKPPSRDPNPAYVHLNEAQNTLEVYNRDDEKLWLLPVADGRYVASAEYLPNIYLTQVADLNGDEKNEVITAVPYAGDRPRRLNSLHVFDAGKKLLTEKKLGEAVHFLQARYSENFNINNVLVDDFDGNGKMEILVSVANERSPFFLIRLDAEGNEIGQYWHFGHLRGVYLADLNNDGRKEIILCGINDVLDDTNESFPVIAVLDPAKMMGKTEAVGSRGFGFLPSQAELYYIRMPRVEMTNLLNAEAAMKYMRPGRDENLIFYYESSTADHVPIFDYTLTKDMRVTEVKSNEATFRLNDRLVQEGKTLVKMDSAYFENLKTGVKYWDGKEWRNEVVQVEHGEVK
jgi:hypothetical protein